MADRSVIWLTDNSRYMEGLDRCMRSRFLTYHSGPTGYGITRKAESIPLATGKYVHAGTFVLDQYLVEHDQLPPDDVVRAGVQAALADYERIVTVRGGFANLDQSERSDQIVREQKVLIEGLVWAYRLMFLPWLHEHCRLVQAEREELIVVGCTCGLGDMVGTLEEHELRGCEGIGWQSKPDIITDYRARPGVYAYWEKKTLGYPNEPWESKWERAPQFSAGALGASARLGVPISESYVIGLIKGKREGDTYNPETKRREGALMQNSPLCYGYRRPGNPPLTSVDWQIEYDYKDAEGKNRRLSRDYQKTGIWQIAEDEPEVRAAGISVSEFWCKWMPPQVLGKQTLLVGPLNINPTLTHDIVEELVAEEQKWKGIVWELYEVIAGEAQGDWTHPAYQAALRRLVPRSWACRRYGKRHECQHVGICFGEEGWQDPLGTGRWVQRRPHHEPELQQLEARGLAPEDGWTDDQEEFD